jgi:type II secretory pathway pseudopilin PulG
VITIIGIVLAVSLGSFHGWGDAQAVRGSAEVVEAALCQAREHAITYRIPVSFEYQTAVDATNTIRKIAQFQLLQETSISSATNQTGAGVSPQQYLGAVQRLPSGVWMVREWPADQMALHASDRFVFLPNGKVMNPIPGRTLDLYVVSRKKRSDGLPNILYRITLDAANGTVHLSKLNPNDWGTNLQP